MASYVNPLHRDRRYDSGLEHIDFAYEPYVFDDKALFEMESLSDRAGNTSDKVNIFVVFVFILEILVLVFLSVLEYFLRATDVFPVRAMNFSCTDRDISYVRGSFTYEDFAYNADVSYNVIVPLCFCLPPFLILICEIALWAFTEEQQKTVRVLCRPCKMPQVFRRMIRYIGTFLFGLLLTMIFVDVTKMFVGRLRPNFLEICKPAGCTAGFTNNENVCQEKDEMKIRDARLSFPSLMAAMTSFSACFMAIYLHNVLHSPSVRIMKPFLAMGFMIMAVMCALARYGLHYNYWTDSMVGFGFGIIVAVYLCVFVLNEFRERLSNHRLYQRLRSFMADQRAMELRDFYKENWDRVERNGYMTYPPPAAAVGDGYSLTIPRPHVTSSSGQLNESNTDIEFPVLSSRDVGRHSPASEPALYRSGGPHYKSRPVQNTFQRDLNRALYQYNRQSSPSMQYGHL